MTHTLPVARTRRLSLCQLCVAVLALALRPASAGSFLKWSPGFQFMRWTSSAGGFIEKFPCLSKIPKSGWTPGGLAYKRWTPVAGAGCDDVANPGVCGRGTVLVGKYTDLAKNVRVEKSDSSGSCVAKLEAYRDGGSLGVSAGNTWSSGFIVGSGVSLAGNANLGDDSIKYSTSIKFPASPKVSAVWYLQSVGDIDTTSLGTTASPSYRIDVASREFLPDGSAVLKIGLYYLDVDTKDLTRSRRIPQAGATVPIDINAFQDISLIIEAKGVTITVNGAPALEAPLSGGSPHMAKEYFPFYPFTNTMASHFKLAVIEDGDEAPDVPLGTMEIANFSVLNKTRVYIGSVGFFHALIAWLIFLLMAVLVLWAKCSRFFAKRRAKNLKTKVAKVAKAPVDAPPAAPAAQMYTNNPLATVGSGIPSSPQRRSPHAADPAASQH